MASLRAYLASLGPAGAVANARAALEEQARNEGAVAGLEARMAVPAPAAALAAPVAA